MTAKEEGRADIKMAGLIAAHDPHGSRVAEGYIVTVSSGTSLDELAFEDIVGTDRAHSIAYVESCLGSGRRAPLPRALVS